MIQEANEKKREIILTIVALKQLAVEEFDLKALDLLDKFVSNDLDFMAPSLFPYESVNGLMIARKEEESTSEESLTLSRGLWL